MRPKEFSTGRVLEKCIALFWNSGYKATSIDNVRAVTDVNRASLYNEFGNKEGLLSASLDLYFDRYIRPKLSELEQPSEYYAALLHFYKSFFSAPAGNGTPNGCYTIAISTEVGRELESVNERLRILLEAIEQSIRKVAKQSDRSLTQTMLEQLLGLFCSSVGICLVMSEAEVDFYLQSNLKLILHAETGEPIR